MLGRIRQHGSVPGNVADHQSKLSTSSRLSWKSEEDCLQPFHWMGDHLGIHGVVGSLILLEDCHQSCRKHTKAGASCSNVLPLDEVE